MSKHFSTKIHSLDHPLVSLDNTTLQTTICWLLLPMVCTCFFLLTRVGMAKASPLFFLHAITSKEFVEYLPKYLQQAHGDAVYCWFTTDAVAEAKEMGWDATQQCPMSQDGINLKADLQSMDFEWCLPTPLMTKLASGAATIDMDNMSLLSFQTLENKGKISHPAGPVTTVPDSPALTATPKLPPSSNSVASDNIMADSTIATHLSALETNWKQILQCLDNLATLGAPSPSTGLWSTSTPPVHLTLGSAAADLGTRV